MNILIVVDMQNDFIDGALGTKEAVLIVDKVKSKIEQYRNNSDTVIFTRDTHSRNYLNTAEGKKLPVEHCIDQTYGWEISSVLSVDNCDIIDKPSFGSIELAEYVADIEDVKNIELVGLCTDICVISNAIVLKARLPENKIMVDSSCCAGVTPLTHNNALEAMKMCHIDVV